MPIIVSPGCCFAAEKQVVRFNDFSGVFIASQPEYNAQQNSTRCNINKYKTHNVRVLFISRFSAGEQNAKL